MNVYHKEWHPEFIKELPIDFNKIKNTDLSFIPTEYHGLFTTDWNWGKWSSMSMDKRMTYQQLYLEYQHNCMKATINSKQTSIEKPIVGFIKD